VRWESGRRTARAWWARRPRGSLDSQRSYRVGSGRSSSCVPGCFSCTVTDRWTRLPRWEHGAHMSASSGEDDVGGGVGLRAVAPPSASARGRWWWERTGVIHRIKSARHLLHAAFTPGDRGFTFTPPRGPRGSASASEPVPLPPSHVSVADPPSGCFTAAAADPRCGVVFRAGCSRLLRHHLKKTWLLWQMPIGAFEEL